jgi:hypothetical protein
MKNQILNHEKMKEKKITFLTETVHEMIHHTLHNQQLKFGEKRVLEHYLGKFANEMVKWCFWPILLTFYHFYLQNYIIFIFYPCPKV